MRAGLAIALLLCGGLAHAGDLAAPERPAIVLAAGLGGGYELAGVNLGLGLGPIEAFIGLGYATARRGGVVGGLRWVHAYAPGDAFFVTAQGGHLIAEYGDDFFGEVYEVALLAGYRATFWQHLFLEAGLGPAYFLTRTPGAGFHGSPLLDVDLGFGVRF